MLLFNTLAFTKALHIVVFVLLPHIHPQGSSCRGRRFGCLKQLRAIYKGKRNLLIGVEFETEQHTGDGPCVLDVIGIFLFRGCSLASWCNLDICSRRSPSVTFKSFQYSQVQSGSMGKPAKLNIIREYILIENCEAGDSEGCTYGRQGSKWN